MPTSPNAPSEGEMVTVDARTGQRTDAVLHDEILDGIDPQAEMALRQGSIKHATKLGLSPEQIALLYEQPRQQKGQKDKRLKRWLDLGFSPEEAAAMVKQVG